MAFGNFTRDGWPLRPIFGLEECTMHEFFTIPKYSWEERGVIYLMKDLQPSITPGCRYWCWDTQHILCWPPAREIRLRSLRTCTLAGFSSEFSVPLGANWRIVDASAIPRLYRTVIVYTMGMMLVLVHIERSILVILNAYYNTGNKSMRGSFDPPTQVTISNHNEVCIVWASQLEARLEGWVTVVVAAGVCVRTMGGRFGDPWSCINICRSIRSCSLSSCLLLSHSLSSTFLLPTLWTADLLLPASS